MISDYKTAKHISDTLLKCSGDINELISSVQKQCSTEEFDNFRDSMSKVMVGILEEGLNPLYEKHPELKPSGFE